MDKSIDLEALMAKSLGDNFFWEHTTRTSEFKSKDVLEIQRVQKKFRPRKPGERKLDTEATPDFSERVMKLRDYVAAAFNITIEELSDRSRPSYNGTAKAFYMWCACRYFPQLNMNKLSKLVDRYYTTVSRGREIFEAEAHLHPALVEKMDKLMGYR